MSHNPPELDPGGPKTYRSYGSRSTTLPKTMRYRYSTKPLNVLSTCTRPRQQRSLTPATPTSFGWSADRAPLHLKRDFNNWREKKITHLSCQTEFSRIIYINQRMTYKFSWRKYLGRTKVNVASTGKVKVASRYYSRARCLVFWKLGCIGLRNTTPGHWRTTGTVLYCTGCGSLND